MSSLKRLALASILTLTSTGLVFGQSQPSSSPQTQDKIVIERSEVVVDAIVRDKKGRPITNLSARDFEIYEDGVRQEIDSFRLATTLKPRLQESAATVKQSAPNRSLGTVPLVLEQSQGQAIAIVFDRLSGGARNQAHAAAQSYVTQLREGNDFIGVFRTDQSLTVVQNFTNSSQLVREAIERDSREGHTVYVSGEKEMKKLWEDHDRLKEQLSNAPQGGASGLLMADLAFIDYRILVAEDFERIERDQQGYSTPNALLALINAMRNFPGRKALVLFSEGIAIPSTAAALFRSVISNANDAGVSIYTIDAAGLRVESSDTQTATAISRVGQKRIEQAMAAEDPTGIGTKPMLRDLERNEDLVRKSPEGGLRQLANDTGGASLTGSNDLAAGLRKVNEDLHSYYLLTYTPQNRYYDGAYRDIAVRVLRPNMEVQTRKGYYALPEFYDSPVLDYEAPGLAILGGVRPGDAFHSQCAAFHFPEPSRPGLVPVLVEVPAGAISFYVDNARTKYASNFSIVVLIRDEAGHVVRKLSTQYLLNGPYGQLDKVLNGKILFYKETQLEQGSYGVSSVVYDAYTKQASSSAAKIVVPASRDLQVSSIVLVKNAEQVSVSNKYASRLLRFKDALLYPNLGESISRSDDKELKTFLTAYMEPGDSLPKAFFEVSQGGHTLGSRSYDLAEPDQTGRIQFATSIDLDKFPPGDYELEVTVRTRLRAATRATYFKIEP